MIVGRRHLLPNGTGLPTAAVSAAAFATSGIFATSLLRAGWSPGAAVTVRLLVAALALTLPASRQLRAHRGALRRGWRNVVLYGLIPVASSQLCYFEAVQHLSVAVALLLEYSGTLLVLAWMWARHHQAPTPKTAAGAAAAVAGLILVLDLVGDHHISPVGVLWGLGAAVSLAAYFIASAGDREGAVPALVVAWSGLTVGTVAMALAGAAGIVPFTATATPVVLAGTRVSWLVPLLGVGLVAGAFAYVTGISAARALGARLASFVGLAEVLFAAVYAWLLLGQRLTGEQMLGGLLVVAGMALVRLGEADRPEAPAVEVGPGAEEELEALQAA